VATLVYEDGITTYNGGFLDGFECSFYNDLSVTDNVRYSSTIKWKSLAEAPASFGEAPVSFGEAPVSFGEAPASFDEAPASLCTSIICNISPNRQNDGEDAIVYGTVSGFTNLPVDVEIAALLMQTSGSDRHKRDPVSASSGVGFKDPILLEQHATIYDPMFCAIRNRKRSPLGSVVSERLHGENRDRLGQVPRARLIIQRTKNLGLLAYLILMKYPTKKFFRLYQT
jgi:hypothetical protein